MGIPFMSANRGGRSAKRKLGRPNAAPPSAPPIEALEDRLLLSVNWAPYPRMLQQDLAVSQFPYLNGSGMTIAVIDRGIDYNHPQIGAGKILTGVNFRDNSGILLDDYGHGTGV